MSNVKKPKILFPFTEAGMGHIMPMRAIADEFERLYGDKTEIIRSQFFTEGGKKILPRSSRLWRSKYANITRGPRSGGTPRSIWNCSARGCRRSAR
ncbi:MAG: hypothetical protein ACLUSP_02420 [Christensenellales bacterium]